MPKSPHVLLVAGDPSADRHGAALIDALKTETPSIQISAMGGRHLRAKADRFLYPLAEVGGFGFWEPILKLPQLWSAWTAFKKALQENRPDVVVTMDYYGFNIRAAAYAHKNKIPVVYYISPQVWASRPGRIQTLGACIDKMLVIFPFEEAIYQKAGIPVRFVGHPLVERLPVHSGHGSLYCRANRPDAGIAAREPPRGMCRVLIETAERLRQEFLDTAPLHSLSTRRNRRGVLQNPIWRNRHGLSSIPIPRMN